MTTKRIKPVSTLLLSISCLINCGTEQSQICIADNMPTLHESACCSKKALNGVCCWGDACMPKKQLPDLTVNHFLISHHIENQFDRTILFVDVNHDENGTNTSLGHFFEVANIGKAKADPVILEFSIARELNNGSIDQHRCIGPTSKSGGLDPGQIWYSREPFYCSVDLTNVSPGLYRILLNVDPENQVAEELESNNTIRSKPTITVQ